MWPWGVGRNCYGFHSYCPLNVWHLPGSISYWFTFHTNVDSNHSSTLSLDVFTFESLAVIVYSSSVLCPCMSCNVLVPIYSLLFYFFQNIWITNTVLMVCSLSHFPLRVSCLVLYLGTLLRTELHSLKLHMWDLHPLLWLYLETMPSGMYAAWGHKIKMSVQVFMRVYLSLLSFAPKAPGRKALFTCYRSHFVLCREAREGARGRSPKAGSEAEPRRVLLSRLLFTV